MIAQIQRDGFNLNTFASGNPNGPAILLSNSLGTGLQMWEPQRAALEATHYIIGYDTRGHGDSGTPPEPYSFEDLVGDALAVVDHYGVERAAMMGVSIGGMTGLGVALTAPDRISKLICACARADNPQPFIQSWDDRMAIIDKHGVQALWPKTSQVWLTPEFHNDHADQLKRLEETFKQTTNAGYKGCAEALKKLSYLDQLDKMTVPTLYIAGEKDMGAPPSVMQEMAAKTPGSAFVEIADAAHIANLNKPEEFTQAMTDFLE